MCFAKPKLEGPDPSQFKGNEKGRRVRWRAFTHSMVSNKLVQAFRGIQLQNVIGKNQQEIRERIKSATLRATARVNRVSHWVFRLSFAKLVIPLLLLSFLRILSPHTEIQFGVLGGVFVFAFAFFFATKNRRNIVKKSGTQSNYLELKKRGKEDEEVVSAEEETSLDCFPQSLAHKFYICLPLNLVSRLWGIFASIRLPPPFDRISVYVYCRAFACNRAEAELDLSQYKTITQFFTRRLQPNIRPLSPSPLVSPCDGTVTFSGAVKGHLLEQVKGVHYSLRAFLGSLEAIEGEHQLQRLSEQQFLPLTQEDTPQDNLEDLALEPYQQNASSSLLFSPVLNQLHQLVVYLGPQDYHRFHSPVSWSVVERRHFPGQLLSVSPGVVSSLPGLFHTNERAVFLGHHSHGFFALVAVGATNVGSIVTEFDQELTTNRWGSSKEPAIRVYDEPLHFEKGQEFGHFKFGSTIVLLFEAPRDFRFSQAQEYPFKVKMGSSL